MIKDRKLKLRYGKLKTPYKHFTLLAPVVIEDYIEELDVKPGKAYAGMKVWAVDYEGAAEVYQSISEQIGFLITGNIEIYDTDANNPPKDEPYAYDVSFNYYK